MHWNAIACPRCKTPIRLKFFRPERELQCTNCAASLRVGKFVYWVELLLFIPVGFVVWVTTNLLVEKFTDFEPSWVWHLIPLVVVAWIFDSFVRPSLILTSVVNDND